MDKLNNCGCADKYNRARILTEEERKAAEMYGKFADNHNLRKDLSLEELEADMEERAREEEADSVVLAEERQQGGTPIGRE